MKFPKNARYLPSSTFMRNIDLLLSNLTTVDLYTKHTNCSRLGRWSELYLYCLVDGHLFNINSAGSLLPMFPLSLYFWISLSTRTSSIALFHDVS